MLVSHRGNISVEQLIKSQAKVIFTVYNKSLFAGRGFQS